MQQQPQPPKKMKSELPKWEIKIENKEIILNETAKTELKYDPQGFIKFYRQFEQQKEQFEKQLSEDHLQKVREALDDINKQIELLKPYADKADKMLKEDYYTNMVKGAIQANNYDAAVQMMRKLPEEMQKKIRANLTKTQFKILDKNVKKSES